MSDSTLNLDRYNVFKYHTREILEKFNDYYKNEEVYVDLNSLDKDLETIKNLESILFEIDGNLESHKDMEGYDFYKEDSADKIREFLNDVKRYNRESDLSLEKNISEVSKFQTKKLSEVNKEEKSNLRRLIEKVFEYIDKTYIEVIWSDGLDKKVQEFISRKYPQEGRTQIFLSHAYTDRFYTIGLFELFYTHGIYLYIDWMHQPANQNVQKLKFVLTQAINKSEQIIFLRTLNSELALQGGNKNIRQWCSWELGNFDYKESMNDSSLNNRFYIDRYRKNRKKNTANQLIQNYLPLGGVICISNGRIIYRS